MEYSCLSAIDAVARKWGSWWTIMHPHTRKCSVDDAHAPATSTRTYVETAPPTEYEHRTRQSENENLNWEAHVSNVLHRERCHRTSGLQRCPAHTEHTHPLHVIRHSSDSVRAPAPFRQKTQDIPRGLLIDSTNFPKSASCFSALFIEAAKVQATTHRTKMQIRSCAASA